MIQKQKGFTLMITVFILVVLALAGVYLLEIGIGQQQIVNYELLTARAHLANQSAYQLFLQQRYQNKQSCQDSTYHFGYNEKALSGYEVKITCLQTITYPKENPHFIAWQLKSKATYGQVGDREYVSQEETRWHIVSANAN